MRLRRVAPLFLLLAASCVDVPEPVVIAPAPEEPEPVASAPVVQPAPETAPPIVPGPPLSPARLEGQFEQGGYIRGIAPFDTFTATVDGEPFDFDPETRGFFIGLDRDAESETTLVFTARDGQSRTHRIEVAPRDWDIERVNVARRPPTSSEAFRQRRSVELEAIWSARAEETGAEGWLQDFIWPVTGRISGRFGSQRIYRGEPGSYHSGLDIAPGNGAPFVAPADGVVVLAQTGYSLEGGIVLLDHGAGLNSAFIHLSRIAVREGESVRQGQLLGNVGASGRATGPHLHWSLVWKDRRLDPLQFLPPMP